LAGTVAFPTPFPSAGTISLAVGHLTYSPCERPKDRELVIVQDQRDNRRVVRLMLQEDVSAVLVAGTRDESGVFRISRKPRVDDLEQGEWFLDSDVNAGTIRERLNLQDADDISTPNSILRGIVFVAEDRPIIHTTEIFQTAGEDVELVEIMCCTSCRPKDPTHQHLM
jgi:hypothetical protein